MVEMAAELGRLGELAREGLDLCGEARGREPSLRSRALGLLEDVDRRILALSSRQVAAFLLQPLIQKIIDGAGPSGVADGLELSGQLYGELAESCSYQEALIARALARRRIPSSSSGERRS
jgi:hypothetical protein